MVRLGVVCMATAHANDGALVADVRGALAEGLSRTMLDFRKAFGDERGLIEFEKSVDFELLYNQRARPVAAG